MPTIPIAGRARSRRRLGLALAAVTAVTLLSAPLSAAAESAPEPSAKSHRFTGETRYDVAANVTEFTFDPGLPVVYIASGETFPDALSAGPAAAHQSGALLLVTSDSVPDVTRQALVDLKPQKLVVVGGPNSVSDTVVAQLAALQPDIVRIGGADRYEVSRNVIDYAFCNLLPGTATSETPCAGLGSFTTFVATGAGYSDALAAGPAAAYERGAVLLVNGSAAELDAPTHELLVRAGAERGVIAGGSASVSDGIQNDLASSLESLVRYGGADRFEVAAGMSLGVFPAGTGKVFIASGSAFADALSAGPAAAVNEGPLLLVRYDCYPPSTKDAIFSSDFTLTNLYVMGGFSTIEQGFVTKAATCG